MAKMANNDKINEIKKNEAEMDDNEARSKTLTADELAIEEKKNHDEQAIDPESVADV